MADSTVNDRATICAVATPPGVGGLAVVRVSGPQALAAVGRLWRGKPLGECATHTAHLGWLADSHGERLDQAVATLFRAPRSYTGDDTVELSVHGSAYIQRELLNALMAAGCRMAEPGEFTRRAFAAGRLDLAEAEAVADLVAASSRASHRLAISQMRGDFSSRIAQLRESLLQLASLLELELDFADQDVELAPRERLLALATEVRDGAQALAATFRRGQALRDGIPTAIVGATNVGKSTLLNRLLHDDRAIVSDIHGTTRDTVEDTADIAGITFRFIDTAGLRPTADPVEALGIDRSLRSANRAAIVLLVADASRPATLADAWRQLAPSLDCTALLLLWNKADLAAPPPAAAAPEAEVAAYCRDRDIALLRAAYCARSGQGCDLEALLLKAAAAAAPGPGADVVVANARHYQALADAAASAARVVEGLGAAIPPEFVAQDLRQTLDHLGAITGAITTPEILASIFSRFCVGK